MQCCKSGANLDDRHVRELERFRGVTVHEALAIGQALHYCVTENICVPPWLLKGATALICELLPHRKASQRGRTASPIARYRQDYRDFERWHAVKRIRQTRVRTSHNRKFLGKECARLNHLLNHEETKARGRNEAKLRDLREELTWRRYQLADKDKRSVWLRNGPFECASRYLAGREARVGADGMRASFFKVERALKDPREQTRYIFFEDDFLRNFGFCALSERKPGTKSLPLYSRTG